MAEQGDVQFLRVTNGLTTVVRGRYAGEDYVWKPGASLDIGIEAAKHIFGFGETDKTWALNGLGWMRSSDMYEAAMEKLANISFDEIQQVFQLPKKRTRKLGFSATSAESSSLSNDRSLVNAEGPEGEDAQPSPDDPSFDAEAI